MKSNHHMGSLLAAAGCLLFGSGICALLYQIAWLNELKMVFGFSTAASASVVGIFMAGLGTGSLIVGRFIDSHPRPLRMYAYLELAIGGYAFLVPALMGFIREIYISTGGVVRLGYGSAVLIRLGLSAIVLAIPTVLMGGTLPAMISAMETRGDLARRHTGFLYAMNTMGGVVGAGTATFFLLEYLGKTHTVWAGALLNIVVGLTAWALSRVPVDRSPTQHHDDSPVRPAEFASRQQKSLPSRKWILLAMAAAVGFAFFLMEIVWYRMLAPVLGGSTYTFGLILILVLTGIGIGGAIYGRGGQQRRKTLVTLSLTCALEAGFLAIPYGLGDRIAIMAAVLRSLDVFGFTGLVLSWTLVAALVILPSAIVAGYQFPMLIGLLGTRNDHAGRETGQAYACNTAGAILGIIAGGFVLLPGLTAPGCWRFTILLLAVLSLIIAFIAWREVGKTWTISPMVIACMTGLILLADGPTAAWRHSPIGAGRVHLEGYSQNDLQEWIHEKRRGTQWEAEGLESSVGILNLDSLSLMINGKSDGNARQDASTQVMMGMIGAALHPEPKRVLVIGLGTGSTAGWLAQIPSITQVDVVELEPAVVEMARHCRPVNQNVLDNPKIRMFIADGREFLLTCPDTYDLIVSAPSNPYRAGISSLYTRQFYQSAKKRLNKGGIFSQWVQAYEVDTDTIGIIYNTLGSVFAFTSTWQTNPNDLLLVCSATEPTISVEPLRARLKAHPFAQAMLHGWATTGLEGFLSRFVASPQISQMIVAHYKTGGYINTDDRMLIEYRFARQVGKSRNFSIESIRNVALSEGKFRPKLSQGFVNWEQVEDNRHMMFAAFHQPFYPDRTLAPAIRIRATAYNAFITHDRNRVINAWNHQPRKPIYPLEYLMLSDALANLGNKTCLPLIQTLEPIWPINAKVALARYLWRTNQPDDAMDVLTQALRQLPSDPWFETSTVKEGLKLAVEMADHNKAWAQTLYQLLATPFSVRIMDDFRLKVLLDIGRRIDPAHTAEAVSRFEPYPLWTGEFLNLRYSAYQATQHPLTSKALQDLTQFSRHAPIPFQKIVRQKQSR